MKNGSCEPNRMERLESRTLFAAIELLKGVNTATASIPSETEVKPVNAGARLFFVGNESSTGKELWTSDGTTAGTRIVVDLSTGAASTTIRKIAGAANLAIFHRDIDLTYRQEIYRTDGTAAGTALLGNFAPSTLVSISATTANLFYSTTIGATTTLYRIPVATPTATPSVVGTYTSSIAPISGSGANAANLYWTVGSAIYRCDAAGTAATIGTIAGTNASGSVMSVADTYLLVNTSSGQLRSLKFSTGAWTTLANDTGRGFTVMGDRTGYVAGNRALMTNGSSITSFGLDNYNNGAFVEMSGSIYVVGRVSTHYELYRHVLSAGTTSLVYTNPNPGSYGSNPSNLIAFNGKLYFSAYTTTSGFELWKTDGTSAGSSMVENAMPEGESSNPIAPTVLNGKLLYMMERRAVGLEWNVLTTTATTPVVLLDINQGLRAADPQSGLSISLNGRAYFNVADYANATGTELWVSDGTTTGTRMLRDVAPGLAEGYAIAMAAFGNRILFTTNQNGLWITDGTTAGTTQIATLSGRGDEICVASSGAFALIGSGVAGASGGLWRIDAALTLTKLQGVDRPLYGAKMIREVGNRFGFAGNDGTTGDEIWFTDGTTAGTYQIGNRYPDPGTSSNSYFVRDAVAHGGNYFLEVMDGNGGSYFDVWRSDGIETNTIRMIHSQWNTASNPTLFTLPSGAMYLINSAFFSIPESGGEVQLIRAFSFYATSAPYVWKGRAYFRCESMESNGGELFVTDGTPAGTGLLAEINPDPYPTEDSDPGWFTGTSGALFFVARTNQLGMELYRTDGTTAGTRLVADLNTGTAHGQIVPLGQAGNQMIFWGTSPAFGYQLYRTTIDSDPPRVASAQFEFETSHSFAINFDEGVGASLAQDDLTVTNAATGALVAGWTLEQSTDSSGATRARIRFASILPDGRYQITLRAGAVGDQWGNSASGAFSSTFHVLAGDVNRDAAVSFDDLLVLAQNYGQSGRTFSSGNVDYSPNGLVDFSDLLMIAQRYGTSLSLSSPSLSSRRREPLDSAAESLLL